ncbi:HNH endonuclease signature motif containing protein [Flavobacterium sp.]|uniref:HNH endonuclease n=1 Tax=Flavobacterium sp. TaxID=239 RepID=UPI002605A74F|nr:HNH endonuclease signature motif containing protein [Flavobacterium sp.]
MNVREKLPVRRKIPTKSPKGKNWSEHKSDLQEDFHYHCGYCGSYDGFRHTYFEVDHFVPKSLFEKGRKIKYCQYDNLVYSCKFCNNNKSSKWPSKRISISIVNNEGFIDPCDIKFDDHLYRTSDGGILWKSDLGKYFVEQAFKFDERDYGIKLLWELNQRRKLLDVFIEEMKKRIPGSKDYNDIEEQAKIISLEYYTFDKELMDYYNSI